MKRWLIIIGVVVLIAIGALTIKTDTGEKERALEKERAEGVVANLQSEKCEIGESFEVGNLEYKIEKLYKTYGLMNHGISDEVLNKLSEHEREVLQHKLGAFSNSEVRGKDEVYLIAKINIKNINEENSKSISASMLKLLKGDGKIIELNEGAMYCIKENVDFFLGDIVPGDSKTGYVVFEVEDLEADYWLRVEDAGLSEIKRHIFLGHEKIKYFKQ